MGLFVMDRAVPQTKETCVTTAIANLELYLEEGGDLDYLLDLAENCIKKAKEMDDGQDSTVD